jgi:hypothetical protein
MGVQALSPSPHFGLGKSSSAQSIESDKSRLPHYSEITLVI